jgi:hypothetical protein
MQKPRVVTLRFRTGRQKMALARWTNANLRGVRVHVRTGYSHVEGTRRTSRNGRVSLSPTEIPNVTIRNFCIALLRVGRLSTWLWWDAGHWPGVHSIVCASMEHGCVIKNTSYNCAKLGSPASFWHSLC